MRPTKLYVDYIVMPIRRTLAQAFFFRATNINAGRYMYELYIYVGRLGGCFLEQRQAKNTL